MQRVNQNFACTESEIEFEHVEYCMDGEWTTPR